MKILVIGKHGYVSTSFQTYMKKFTHIQVDAISARDNQWENADFHGYDAVFNTTGLAHNNARIGTDEQFIALNAVLPLNLAKKAKTEGVPVFVNMSSMIVYGNMSAIGDDEKITADTVPTPDNIYGKSKLMGEQGILELNDESFHVSAIRSPLVYGENAVDNFEKLTKYAMILPIFPDIENARSMIYADNLCELVRLIMENKSSGVFYPQQECYISTSRIIKDIAKEAGHSIWFTKIFNPVLRVASKRVLYVCKIFGNLAYDMETSNHFEGKYRVVNYSESIRRIVAKKR